MATEETVGAGTTAAETDFWPSAVTNRVSRWARGGVGPFTRHEMPFRDAWVRMRAFLADLLVTTWLLGGHGRGVDLDVFVTNAVPERHVPIDGCHARPSQRSLEGDENFRDAGPGPWALEG